MKGTWQYIILATVLLSVMIAVYYIADHPTDWTPTYSKDQKIPYGTKIAYDLMKDIFPEGDLIENNEPPFVLFKETYQNTNYIAITNDFSPDKYEVDRLLEYVSMGNRLFISAYHISGKFADTLNLDLNYWDYFSFFGRPNKYNMKDSFNIYLEEETEGDTVFYKYPVQMINSYLDEDNDSLIILGRNSVDYPNFVMIKIGSGFIYIHTLPGAFTNFHIHSKEGVEYVEKVLTHLPETKTIWSGYYNPGIYNSYSLLRYILKSPSFRYAYYLTLISLVVFILFTLKRRQRIIPVIPPKTNTSLEFVNMIGRLYFQKRDNVDIARKKQIYLLEFIKNRYYMTYSEKDDTYVNRLSERSGIELDKVSRLVHLNRYLKTKTSLMDDELFIINNQIEYFYKNCK